MNLDTGPILLETEAATARLAARLAPLLREGDAILLSGPIGAGKSFFARALIRNRMRNPDEDVPSPTFTLVQTYQAGPVALWHADLYRIGHAEEAVELGLVEAFETGICLVEWPDRLGDLTPPDPLNLAFEAHPEGHHSVAITGSERWRQRLEGRLD